MSAVCQQSVEGAREHQRWQRHRQPPPSARAATRSKTRRFGFGHLSCSGAPSHRRRSQSKRSYRRRHQRQQSECHAEGASKAPNIKNAQNGRLEPASSHHERHHRKQPSKAATLANKIGRIGATSKSGRMTQHARYRAFSKHLIMPAPRSKMYRPMLLIYRPISPIPLSPTLMHSRARCCLRIQRQKDKAIKCQGARVYYCDARIILRILKRRFLDASR